MSASKNEHPDPLELTSTSVSFDQKPKKNIWKIFGITIITIAIIIGGIWLVREYLFPQTFTPVVLSDGETQRLNQKLNVLSLPNIKDKQVTQTQLKPEPYSEVNANREIFFSEREVNAMIAHNTDMANNLVIDLSDNLASAKLLIRTDSDLPLFGDKIVRVNMGLELAFAQGKPIVKLRGISAWGVPLPNSWLGGIKNIDLVQEFGDNNGFWQGFAEGIDYINVSEGKLVVKLKP
jgi:hypothetical protein